MAVSGRKADSNLVPILTDASSEDYDIFCTPCDLSDIRLPAFGFCITCKQHLCESCFIKHKQTTTTRNHNLLDKNVQPNDPQLIPKSTNTPHSGDSTYFCPNHSKEPIRFYCHDHEVVLCSVCYACNHEDTHCKVSAISNISQKSFDSLEYKESLQTIDNFIDKCQQIRNDIKENNSISEKSLDTVLEDINQFKDYINRTLNFLGERIEGKIKMQQRENAERLKKADAVCADITKSLDHVSDSIRHHNDTHQADKLFTTLKTFPQMIEDSEKKLSDLVSSAHVKQYYFKANPEIISLVKNADHLGTVEYFSQQKDICVKTPHDKRPCFISGMTLLSDSKLVLADANNLSVKLVDLSDNSIPFQLYIGGNLRHITKINSDQVALTIFREGIVLFLTVSSNKLVVKSTLKIDGHCDGITYSNKRLAITFNDPFPGFFEIMDLKGKVSAKVKVGNPHCITSNDRYIYLYDSEKESVNIYDWFGKSLNTCHCPKARIRCPNARGLALLGDGSVYAVSRSKGTLTQMPADLTCSKVVMTDLKCPTAICWSETNDILFINRNMENEKYDNEIEVYTRFTLQTKPRTLTKQLNRK